MKNTAVLFISHLINENTMEKYYKLKKELSDTCDVIWAIQRESDNDIPLSEDINPNRSLGFLCVVRQREIL